MKALVVVVIATAWASVAQAQPVPVTVSDVQFRPSGELSYVLTNTTNQPITAWAVHLRERQPDGKSTDITATTDKYIADARRGLESDEQVNSRWLMPHQPHSFTLPGSHTNADVTAVAAVFADGAVAGDQSITADVFRRRAVMRDTTRDVLLQLRSVQSSYKGNAAIREASVRLSTPVGTQETDEVINPLKIQLSELAQRVTAQRLDGDVALAHVIQQVERTYNASVKHAVPRKDQ